MKKLEVYVSITEIITVYLFNIYISVSLILNNLKFLSNQK